MRVPVSWLREYVPLEMPLAELAERLSVSAAEVEGIERRGVPDADGNLGLFRVGRVVEAAKHPNADRLQLCRVDVGEAEPRQIVCGAWNFGAGATVAVALPGAVLPDGLELEQRKVRGELSDGMILAEDEVELGTDHAGIMVLAGEPSPGRRSPTCSRSCEDVLLVESTGNRPDLLVDLRHRPRGRGALRPRAAAMARGQTPSLVPKSRSTSTIEDFEGCPRYIGRLFRDVEIGPVADLAQARLLERRHAPDLERRRRDQLRDARARQPAARVRLDHARGRQDRRPPRATRARRCARSTASSAGSSRTTSLIADAERASRSPGSWAARRPRSARRRPRCCSRRRTSSRPAIFRTSERLRLRTEGSNRWEKGVDPHLAEPAAKLATQLIVETAGARWVGHADVHGGLPERPVDPLPARAGGRGDRHRDPADRADGAARAARLRARAATRSSTPTWRARDVTREIDVVEEIARYRLDGVPFTLPAAPRDVRRAHAAAAPAPPRRGRARRPRPRPRRTRPRCGPTTATRARGACRSRSRPSWRCCGRACSRASSTRPAATSSWAPRTSRCSRSRASSCPAASCPTSSVHVAAIVDGGWSRGEGRSWRRSTPRSTPSRASSAAGRRPPPPGQGGDRSAGLVGELHPAVLDGVWGAFELDLAKLLERGARARCATRTSITFPRDPPGPRVRRRRGGQRRRARRRGARGRRSRAARDPALRRLPRRAGRRGPQVDRLRGQRSSRPSGRSPTRTRRSLRERIVAALGERFGAELRA